MSAKDVKSVVLSKSLPGPTPSSVARVEHDYVVLPSHKDGKETSGSKTRDSKGERTLGVEPSKESGPSSVGPQKVGALLAGLALTPTTAQELLRQELLQLRFHGSEQRLAESKHLYVIGSSSTISDTETTVALSRITGGTASNTRITNTVRLKHLRLKFTIDRNPSGTSITAGRTPIITVVVWRDNIPSTPGSAPTILGTDTNPPSSGTLMFSRLGSVQTNVNSIVERNPITVKSYHLYKVFDIVANDQATYDYVTPATAYGLPAPRRWRFEHEIDLNDITQNYASYGTSAPDTNDIYVTCWTDLPYTGQGYQDWWFYTSCLTFEDVQD